MAVSAQQPLVDLQLPLVTGMPALVKYGDRFLLRGRLVINNNIVPAWFLPQIVDCAGNGQICRFVQKLDALEILAPLRELLVRGRTCIDAVLFLQRMCGAGSPVGVELSF